MMPSWDDTSYATVDKIAADYLYEGTHGETIKLNLENREVSLEQNFLTVSVPHTHPLFPLKLVGYSPLVFPGKMHNSS
jgi:hypothetical protein